MAELIEHEVEEMLKTGQPIESATQVQAKVKVNYGKEPSVPLVRSTMKKEMDMTSHPTFTTIYFYVYGISEKQVAPQTHFIVFNLNTHIQHMLAHLDSVSAFQPRDPQKKTYNSSVSNTWLLLTL